MNNPTLKSQQAESPLPSGAMPMVVKLSELFIDLFKGSNEGERFDVEIIPVSTGSPEEEERLVLTPLDRKGLGIPKQDKLEEHGLEDLEAIKSALGKLPVRLSFPSLLYDTPTPGQLGPLTPAAQQAVNDWLEEFDHDDLETTDKQVLAPSQAPTPRSTYHLRSGPVGGPSPSSQPSTAARRGVKREPESSVESPSSAIDPRRTRQSKRLKAPGEQEHGEGNTLYAEGIAYPSYQPDPVSREATLRFTLATHVAAPEAGLPPALILLPERETPPKSTWPASDLIEKSIAPPTYAAGWPVIIPKNATDGPLRFIADLPIEHQYLDVYGQRRFDAGKLPKPGRVLNWADRRTERETAEQSYGAAGAVMTGFQLPQEPPLLPFGAQSAVPTGHPQQPPSVYGTYGGLGAGSTENPSQFSAYEPRRSAGQLGYPPQQSSGANEGRGAGLMGPPQSSGGRAPVGRSRQQPAAGSQQYILSAAHPDPRHLPFRGVREPGPGRGRGRGRGGAPPQ